MRASPGVPGGLAPAAASCRGLAAWRQRHCEREVSPGRGTQFRRVPLFRRGLGDKSAGRDPLRGGPHLPRVQFSVGAPGGIHRILAEPRRTPPRGPALEMVSDRRREWFVESGRESCVGPPILRTICAERGYPPGGGCLELRLASAARRDDTGQAGDTERMRCGLQARPGRAQRRARKPTSGGASATLYQALVARAKRTERSCRGRGIGR